MIKSYVLADSCKRTDNQDNDHNESFDDSRKYNKKDSRRTKFSPILSPLEDQTSWSAPAQILKIKKRKWLILWKRNKLMTPMPKKKRVLIKKAKINKYSIYRILLNTPLPGHEQSKPSRHHSEVHIDKKLYGIDATIGLVDDPDKKQSINPKDVAIPESEFKLQSLKPIVLSVIRNVNLIETSDCVFKVGRTIGITKGRIDD
ncbi:hypothetical protein RhiirC2_849967 [Rhizophagus irregularis]|uniref:Uncharacterized protein n=1 Tax=Rhizophagus irregularis TaxID=588596 RepID=A0A2N1N8Z7_9GLOM|nr:hypothetical protein RhiirC2_849967 [Rhizophagus irregularis]